MSRIVPLEVKETEEYFIVEAEMPGFRSEDVAVNANSRIVTVSVNLNSRRAPGENVRKISFSLYLSSPVDPAYTMAHFSRGNLYLKMLKDPIGSIHSPVNQTISG